ncbi:TTAGGG binding factor [Trypanosoma rangeli]|uniref:TTAGGG binding factor n=1 Tax=Trypanosoma rangeli TaxID=5698 RepID=A0A422P0M0_TRYRA|nr:TTAGGG binding factor [Trypanosoma rangeli]RNF11241.1 TTAGGG binding factor [Trypanosoma rangeli]|eukprot:RNF11241.1 TTAGGG binding factor [Trypanosoma rangeli]
MNFTILHEIIRGHIRRGNHFAVLGLLALTVVHEDPAFWQTCTYHDGIASAVIASFLANRGIEGPPTPETRSTGSETSPNISQDPLTANELYIMLRRIRGEDALLSRFIDQLETGSVKGKQGNNRSSNNKGSNKIGVDASLPFAEVQVKLEELCAVLQERFQSRDRRSNQTREVSDSLATTGSQASKRTRESDGIEETCANLVMESTAVVCPEARCLEPVDGHGGNGCSNALDVLARMPPLPGSTRALTSFDAVAGLVTHDKCEASASHGSGGRESEANGGLSCGIATVEPRPKQRRHKFTPEEDEAILQGVARFAKGPGRFESILYAYRGVWHPARTATQLHDHWRGILRQRAVLHQEGYRGKNSLAARGGKSGLG